MSRRVRGNRRRRKAKKRMAFLKLLILAVTFTYIFHWLFPETSETWYCWKYHYQYKYCDQGLPLGGMVADTQSPCLSFFIRPGVIVCRLLLSSRAFASETMSMYHQIVFFLPWNQRVLAKKHSSCTACTTSVPPLFTTSGTPQTLINTNREPWFTPRVPRVPAKSKGYQLFILCSILMSKSLTNLKVAVHLVHRPLSLYPITLQLYHHFLSRGTFNTSSVCRPYRLRLNPVPLVMVHGLRP